MKRAAFVALAVCVSLAAVELISFAASRILARHYQFFDPETLVLTDAEVQRVATRFDARLGWAMGFATPHGERPQARALGNTLAAAYGDSFTFGDEVGDAETWQHHLAEQVGRDVLNFGVPGYGTDQAYLRFVYEFERGGAPIVMLGLIPENINRIVNVYRPAYYARTQIKLTKPRFVLRGGELSLLDNPLRSVQELSRLQDPAFLAQVCAHDAWFQRPELPVLGFPYSGLLFSAPLWHQLGAGRELGGMNARPWVDLWEREQPRALMLAILDAFVAEARRRDATPVLLLMPDRGTVAQYMERGEHGLAALVVMQHAHAHGYLLFDGISLFAGAARKTGLSSLFRGHISPLGNEIFAGALHDYLQGHGLLTRD